MVKSQTSLGGRCHGGSLWTACACGPTPWTRGALRPRFRLSALGPYSAHSEHCVLVLGGGGDGAARGAEGGFAERLEGNINLKGFA